MAHDPLDPGDVNLTPRTMLRGIRHKDKPCNEFLCLPEEHPDHYEPTPRVVIPTLPDPFAAARERHLGQLDLLYGSLRELAGDPNWVNDAWPALRKATECMIAQLAVIRRLNEASAEAETK